VFYCVQCMYLYIQAVLLLHDGSILQQLHHKTVLPPIRASCTVRCSRMRIFRVLPYTQKVKSSHWFGVPSSETSMEYTVLKLVPNLPISFQGPEHVTACDTRPCAAGAVHQRFPAN
jgi:hypothetical protein